MSEFVPQSPGPDEENIIRERTKESFGLRLRNDEGGYCEAAR